MASFSKCMDIVNSMNDADAAALLDRLAEYQTMGIPIAQAQVHAVADILADAKADRAELEALAREQHPDAFEEKSMANESVDQTETPAFKKWFGDSKVVDADGKPLVLYHGSPINFDSFDMGKAVDGAHWFTPNESHAASFGEKVNAVYISMRNPLEISQDDLDAAWDKEHPDGEQDDRNLLPRDFVDGFVEKARNSGHDGLIIRDMGDRDIQSDMYLPLGATQIKSATDNNGNFDTEDIRIHASMAPDETATEPAPAAPPAEPAPEAPKYTSVREAVADAMDSVVQVDFKSEVADNVRNKVASLIMPRGENELSFWGKTIGTPFHKAMMNKAFARVFNGIQRFIEDTSLFSSKAESLARSIFPSVDMTWASIKNFGLSKEENSKLGTILAAGTLHEGTDKDGNAWTDETLLATKLKKDGTVSINPKTGEQWTAEEVRQQLKANPHVGRIFSDEELKSEFGANDRVITAYGEARATINQSLTDYAKSEMAQIMRTTMFGKDTDVKNENQKVFSDIVRGDSNLADALAQMSSILDALEAQGQKIGDARAKINGIASTVTALQKAGYSPLMRFGGWVVQGMNAKGEQVYFSLHADKAEARAAELKLKQEPEIATTVSRELDGKAINAFSGLTPEAAQLFAEYTGADKNEAVQDYLRLVVSSRSVLQRMQKREGVAGFSVDATRTLASFITGNSRKSSRNLHMADIKRDLNASDLGGSYKADAAKLVEYVENPIEEAQKLRGFLFFNYLGASIASGLVNLTQPVLMTMPYLSQFGVARAGKAMTYAAKDASIFLRNKEVADKDLQGALNKAKADGILDPNEVFQLMAAAQQGTGSFGMQKFMRVWGLNFQLTEAYNRSITFIAAYHTARETLKEADGQAQLQKAMNTDEVVTPEMFAAHAIRETQGVYNKGNRPNWARGAVGASIFTFKQFSISYMEFLKRAWGDGLLPKKQFTVALATLFFASGLNGLPGSDDLDDIIDTIGHLTGHATNSKKAKRDFLNSMVGKDFAGALQDGLSHYAPFDVSGRLGAGNFLPATKLLDPAQSAAAKGRTVMELAGVGGGTLSNYVEATGKLAAGDVRGALQTATPTAVSNALKGIEMATTGEYRDTSGRKVQNVDKVDAFLKGIGLQPRDIADDSQDSKITQSTIDTVRWKQTSVNQEYAKALFNNDTKKLDQVRAEIQAWNTENPTQRVQLNMSSVQTQIKEMRMTRDQRMIKSAPKSLKGEVRASLN